MAKSKTYAQANVVFQSDDIVVMDDGLYSEKPNWWTDALNSNATNWRDIQDAKDAIRLGVAHPPIPAPIYEKPPDGAIMVDSLEKASEMVDAIVGSIQFSFQADVGPVMVKTGQTRWEEGCGQIDEVRPTTARHYGPGWAPTLAKADSRRNITIYLSDLSKSIVIFNVVQELGTYRYGPTSAAKRKVPAHIIALWDKIERQENEERAIMSALRMEEEIARLRAKFADYLVPSKAPEGEIV